MACSPHCLVNGETWLFLSCFLAAAAPVNRLELHVLGQATLWAVRTSEKEAVFENIGKGCF